MAPEAISKLQYSVQSDIWSLGITFWEVCTGQDPSKAADLVTLAVQIRDNFYHPRIPPFAPIWLQEILKGCWQAYPSDRISIDEIIRILEGGKVEGEKRANAFSGASNAAFEAKKAVTKRELNAQAVSASPVAPSANVNSSAETEKLKKQNAELEAQVKYLLVRLTRLNGGDEVTLESIKEDMGTSNTWE